MRNYFSEFIFFYSDKRNLIRLAGILIFLGLMLKIYPSFLMFIDSRNGVVLSDPVLKAFAPVNMTWLIFVVLYGGIVSAFFILAGRPPLFEKALSGYAVLIILRIAAMYLVPLDPPEKMIPLEDPFVYIFGTGKTLSKDLFFSGHTSMMFLIALSLTGKKLKGIFIFLSFLVGLAVILQHIHYTIDVFAAPFFSFAAYKISEYLSDRLRKQRTLKSINL